MIAYIGIDPGITGAIGVIVSGGQAFIMDVPTVATAKKNKRALNFYEMYQFLANMTRRYEWIYLTLEKQQAMPQQGVASTFQTGRGYGAWEAICWATTPSFQIVSPRKWKKALGLTNDKELSRELAIKLYPALADELKLKKHHNRAEALLLAHYTKMGVK